MNRRAPFEVRERFAAELAAAGRARMAGRADDAWAALEFAHVLSQPWAGLHTRSHWAMFALAVRTVDVREALGQVARLALAAPGSATGRYPSGNTGRARVSMFAPMPVPDELTELVGDAS